MKGPAGGIMAKVLTSATAKAQAVCRWIWIGVGVGVYVALGDVGADWREGGGPS